MPMGINPPQNLIALLHTHTYIYIITLLGLKNTEFCFPLTPLTYGHCSYNAINVTEKEGKPDQAMISTSTVYYQVT